MKEKYRGTFKEAAEIYGKSAVYQLSYLSEVKPDKWEMYLDWLIQDVVLAAHAGRKSLRHK